MTAAADRLDDAGYRAPRWLAGGHAQTLWPLARKPVLPDYRRERWNTPDGDFIDLDWVSPQKVGAGDTATNPPLLVLFHGLEGSSRSHYARSLMHAVAARGWQGVVVHFRGCSGEPNRLPRAYHSGDADEVDWVLRRLRSEWPQVPLFVAGVSLGGNALLKWLGERGSAAGFVSAAAAVCPPLDLAAANAALMRGFNRVYTHHFLRTLIPAALAKLKRFPGLYDASRVRAANSLYAFDDTVTAPLHGFRDAADYYARASSKQFLGGIEVPTLLLNARNDPFLPVSALPTQALAAPSVLLEQPDAGGHVGFVGGTFPGHLDWLPRRILAYCDSHVPGASAAAPIMR